MAKVMISIPDSLLGMLDAEAERRRTSRSALLQNAARRELGLARRSRDSLLADLDELSRDWTGPVDSAALIRADRRRDN
jgi:Ribbon-helix-helix protein, copG family